MVRLNGDWMKLGDSGNVMLRLDCFDAPFRPFRPDNRSVTPGGGYVYRLLVGIRC